MGNKSTLSNEISNDEKEGFEEEREIIAKSPVEEVIGLPLSFSIAGNFLMRDCPPELLYEIFDFLDFKDVSSVSLTSKIFRAAVIHWFRILDSKRRSGREKVSAEDVISSPSILPLVIDSEMKNSFKIVTGMYESKVLSCALNLVVKKLEGKGRRLSVEELVDVIETEKGVDVPIDRFGREKKEAHKLIVPLLRDHKNILPENLDEETIGIMFESVVYLSCLNVRYDHIYNGYFYPLREYVGKEVFRQEVSKRSREIWERLNNKRTQKMWGKGKGRRLPTFLRELLDLLVKEGKIRVDFPIFSYFLNNSSGVFLSYLLLESGEGSIRIQEALKREENKTALLDLYEMSLRSMKFNSNVTVLKDVSSYIPDFEPPKRCNYFFFPVFHLFQDFLPREVKMVSYIFTQFHKNESNVKSMGMCYQFHDIFAEVCVCVDCNKRICTNCVSKCHRGHSIRKYKKGKGRCHCGKVGKNKDSPEVFLREEVTCPMYEKVFSLDFGGKKKEKGRK